MSQLTLSLLDTTALSGLTLGAGTGPRFREDPVEAAPVPEPERVPAHTFRLSGERALARGWKARAADNLAAIRLMQEIEREDRLARFVGFGAGELANTLFRRQDEAFRPGWEDLGNELEQLVSPAEMAALARSTQYAHYTPEFMVRAVWAALGRLGFAGGTVLEPGCGTGLFLAMMPEKVAARSAATGIEMDPTTAQIAKLLYPDAWIRAEDFTKARLAETFDLAVGNPPFSDRTVRADDAAGRMGLSLHDYFIARSIERLKPGGLAAFVTSRHTMDKVDPKARQHIAAMADLVGAVRMPQGAMLAAAGTEVVVDVLFFQRRWAEQVPGGTAWSDLVEVLPAEDGEPALAVNRYFAEHPQMVLGLHGRTTSPFGVVYTCHYCPTVSLEADLGAALERLPAGIHLPAAAAESTPVRPDAAPRVRVGTAAEGATVKEGSYLVLDGALMQVLDGVPQRVAVKSATIKEGIFAKHARIILGLIPLRDAIRAVLRAQEANEPWGLLQGRLRSAYQLFVRQFGPVTRGDLFTMEVGGKVRRERKEAGAVLLGRIRLLERTREGGAWILGRIGGFELKAAGEPIGLLDYHQDVWLDRHGYEQVIQLDGELTPMGLIARLEYQLDRFEADLAEHRRRVAEAEQRLPGYQRRLGEGFGLQEELDAKRAELIALEVDLAANDRAVDDDAPGERGTQAA